jgi:hypothetical protein
MLRNRGLFFYQQKNLSLMAPIFNQIVTSIPKKMWGTSFEHVRATAFRSFNRRCSIDVPQFVVGIVVRLW